MASGPPAGTPPMGPPPGVPMGPPDPSMIPYVITPGSLKAAHNFVGIGIALNVLAFLTFAGRMYTRSFPVFRMGADDYVMILAYVSISILSKCLSTQH
jgi:hypothetical protein